MNGDPELESATSPSARVTALSVFGMCGFAIAQPLLSLLGDTPALFTFNQIEPRTGFVTAALIALAPPFALAALVLAIRRIHRRTGEALMLVLVVGLATITLIQGGKEVGLEQPQALTFASFAGGLGVAVLWRQFAGVRSWTALLSPLPLLALGLFVFTSPTGDLLRAERGAPAGASRTLAGNDASADGTSDDVASVVVVVFDEFPTKALFDADRNIDPARFPNFAAFAEQSTWYRDHTTLSALTSSALPSLLTGKNPETKGGTFIDHPESLFTLLAPTHHLTVFESFTRLCGLEICTTAAPPSADTPETPETPEAPAAPRITENRRRFASTVLDLFSTRISPARSAPTTRDDFTETLDELPTTTTTVAPPSTETAPSTTVNLETTDEDDDRSVDDLVKDVAQSRSPARLTSFLNTITPDTEPSLRFLHLVLPHSPYLFYADGTLYDAIESDSPYVGFDANNPNDTLAAIGEHRFAQQVEYADLQFGRIIERLERAGTYDDSLIVFVADHGASFGTDTNHRILTGDNFDDIAFSPLMIKYPGQTLGSTDDTNVQLIDILPTIAAELGATISWDHHGFAIGSEEQLNRGDDKAFLNIQVNGLNVVSDDIIAFDRSEHRPDPADRWIGASPDPADPLAQLHIVAGVDGLVGESFSDLSFPSTITGSVHNQMSWAEPTVTERPGLISGRVDAPTGASVVVAVGDTIVGGSKVYAFGDTAGVFNVFVGPGVFDRTGQTIRVGLVTPNGIAEVQLS